MLFNLIIKNNQATLRIKDGKKTICATVFEIDKDFSDLLLVKINSLFEENKLKLSDISKYALQSDIAENYTAYRIAKAVINALSWRYLH